MKNKLFIGYLLSLVACVSATIEEENACCQKQYYFPEMFEISSITETINQKEKIDLSETIKEFDDVGDWNLNFNSVVLKRYDGDWSFLTNATLKIDGEITAQSLNTEENKLNFLVMPNANDIINKLKSGPVEAELSLTGQLPSKPVGNLDLKVCIQGTLDIEQSL